MARVVVLLSEKDRQLLVDNCGGETNEAESGLSGRCDFFGPTRNPPGGDWLSYRWNLELTC